jgi:hypothetical protein
MQRGHPSHDLTPEKVQSETDHHDDEKHNDRGPHDRQRTKARLNRR